MATATATAAAAAAAAAGGRKEFTIPAHPGELGLLKSLRRWIQGETTEPWIHEASIYRQDPISLTARYPPAIAENGERMWYFFCTPQTKKGNDTRISRVAGKGTWKKERTFPVDAHNADLGVRVQLGSKQTFTYMVKMGTNNVSLGWIQHAFLLLKSEDPQGRCLCRIYRTKRICSNSLIPHLAILAHVHQARAAQASASGQTSTAAVPGGGGGGGGAAAQSAQPTAVPGGGGGATAQSEPPTAVPGGGGGGATAQSEPPTAVPGGGGGATAAAQSAQPTAVPGGGGATATSAPQAATPSPPQAAATAARPPPAATPDAAEVNAAASTAPPPAPPSAAAAAPPPPLEAAPPSPPAATTATASGSPPKKWVRVLISGSPTKMKDLSSAKRVYSMAEVEEEMGVAPPHKMVKLSDCRGWLTIDPAK